MLNRVLPENTGQESEALRQLEAFLEPRMKEAKANTPQKSVTDIFEETLQKAGWVVMNGEWLNYGIAKLALMLAL